MDKKKIIIVSVIVVLSILGIVWYMNSKKVETITIDVNNTKSYNLKISMSPSYKTLIVGTKDSIINVNSVVTPNKKINKKINWIINNDCAKIDKDNYIITTGNCEFEIYAKSGKITSNKLQFKID